MESIQVNGVCETHKLPNIMNWSGEQLTPDEIFSHPKFKELQQAHFKNKKHPWCDKCWKSDTPKYKNLSKFEKDCNGLMIDFYCSNQCNLACRHCTPFASSKLRKDLVYFNENNFDILDVTDNFFYDKDQNSLDSIQWEWIVKNPEKISGLTLSGGEPLLMKRIIKVLFDWADTGVSQQINLQLRTNGYFLGKYVHLLNKFKGIYLHLSVDAVDDLYHYIRYPGNFDELEKSYFYFKDKSKNLKDCYISTVVNALNVLNLNEIKLWAEDRIHFVEITPNYRGIGVRSLDQNILDIANYEVPDVKPNKEKMKKEIGYFDLSRKQSYKDYLHPILVEWLND